MNVDLKEAVKPLRKLHKLLNDFPAHPSPSEVHDLRTRARRLEAVVHTCSSNSDRDAQRLLKLIKPIRKAAGKVRDMDVFITKLHQVKDAPEGDGLVRLTEHVANLREKHLGRLHQAIARRRKLARRSIRQYIRSLKSRKGPISPAAPQILVAELDHWPKLHADNLHEFRIRAKELRYMLQLFPDVDRQRMEALGEVKDLAGEWHDWLELHALAEEVLDPKAGPQSSDSQILHRLDALAREKLRAGLTAANRLRRRSIDVPRAA